MKKLSIRDIDLHGKKVLMRVDFNVPLDADRNVTDDTRIQAALPSIQYISEQGAVLVLAAHAGRPKGEKKPEFSLAPAAQVLSSLLGKKVMFLDDCIGDAVKRQIASAQPGDVILLENVRFYKGETANDSEFARQLAEGCDLAVNDAFGTAHRAHASNVGVTAFLSPAAAGFLMEKEIEYFGRVIDEPKRPVVAILGGAKVSGKLQVITNMMQKVDKLLIGGGMTFTFFRAKGLEVGTSLVEEDLIDTAKKILEDAATSNVELLLPTDCVVADKFAADAASKVVSVNEIPEDWMGLDIGPETTALFTKVLNDVKTIVWNGPMGVFEMDAFAHGTMDIARVVAESDAVSIIGGGDTVSAIKKAGVADRVSFISTGGGASLELLEGKALPGIEALTDK
ncbi:phosphoglycerate kinase [candidate division KSB3 bacterium]|uniref:Phosphoglycerate kinase n=1 Tax=candidate division KSB3 bacterium TaxID=2044937 RepID=A0A2G6E195_9BACT|nr:MAG: phosphoglycerate kinase [candidate division KSB3 bacterium]PIE30491.1 MAG: phosphoglycerate kinase [candidate division KSB3 bacterium]